MGKICYVLPETACLHVQIKKEGKKTQGRIQQAGDIEDVYKIVLFDGKIVAGVSTYFRYIFKQMFVFRYLLVI